MNELVKVRKPTLPYVLLTPVDSKPNTDILITHHSNTDTWLSWFNSVRESDVIALDIETRGTNPVDPESMIVGIGFSHGRSSLYIDVQGIGGLRQLGLVDTINKLPACIGHNIYFDWSFLREKWECEPKWVACTYGMLRQMATEGFFGQRWGLKPAQENLLGWTETNETQLDEWLVAEGYIKSIKKPSEEIPAGYYPFTNDKDEQRYGKPDKGEMWRAPRDILGHYCALDCDSTWQLYTDVLLPRAQEHEELLRYHEEEYLCSVDVHVTQKLVGIRVDLEGLAAHAVVLRKRMDEVYNELHQHKVTGPLMQEWEKEKAASYLEKQPAKYKKGKDIPTEPAKYVKLKPLGPEPTRLTTKGKPNKNWIKWKEKKDQWDELGGQRLSVNWIKWDERVSSGHYEPEISLNWVNWTERVAKIQRRELPEYCFNLASPKQLPWMLYDKIFDYELVREHTDRQPGIIRLIRDSIGLRPVELDMTESGALPTDAKALMQMGEVGAILLRYNNASKELSYVEAYMEMAVPREDGTGTLHPSFRLPGTLTGRLSGNAPNLQQIPKSREVLDCLIPREGYKFVQCDHTALENVVLAELSRDPALMNLYGPGAEPHDSYLFNAAKMYENSGVEIFKEIAAAYVPDPEVISKLKHTFKNVRGISKKTTLSKNYGIGAEKLYKDLLLQGADVTREEVTEIHRAYDEVYAGVASWGAELTEEWRVNGGWVTNGIGRPIGASDRKKKDLVNQVCQSTGHDIHMRYIYHLVRLLDERIGPENWNPIVIDLHDESIVEVREEYTEAAKTLMEKDLYDIINAELGGRIPLAGGGMISDSFSGFKLEG